MYRVILEFKDNLPEEKLQELKKLAAEAYNNRAGSVKDQCKELNRCIFEGGEEKEGCLNLGSLFFDKLPKIRTFIKQWDWIDEEYPEENCSILKSFINFDEIQRKVEYAER